jgi:hypothetical protein
MMGSINFQREILKKVHNEGKISQNFYYLVEVDAKILC